MSTDIIEQAKHHNWWYSDTNLATLLIHEVERLRRDHEKTWADAQLKAAEIERLRGLLREALDPYMAATVNWRTGWTDRVREALGE